MMMRGWPRSLSAPPLPVSLLSRSVERLESRAISCASEALVPEASVPFAGSGREGGFWIIVVVVGRAAARRRGVGETVKSRSALASLASIAATASVVASKSSSSYLIHI